MIDQFVLDWRDASDAEARGENNMTLALYSVSDSPARVKSSFFRRSCRIWVRNLRYISHMLYKRALECGYTFADPRARVLGALKIQVSRDEYGDYKYIKFYQKHSGNGWIYAEFVELSHKLPIAQEDVAKAYGFTPSKIGAINDARALSVLFSAGMTAATLTGDCLNDMKTYTSKRVQESLFPQLDSATEEYIRQAYFGGYIYINPAFRGKILDHIYSYDVNAQYASYIADYPLPVKAPRYYTGAPPADASLYIAHLRAHLELKPDAFPSLKLRSDRLDVDPDYITSTGGEYIDLTLSSVDIELMKIAYNTDIEYIDGFYFAARTGIYVDYVNKWYDIKRTAPHPAQRTIAKHHLTHLYGIFGRYKTQKIKVPEYSNNAISWRTTKITRSGGYLPYAIFITAYARRDIYLIAMQNKDRFVCAQTDSLKFIEPVQLPLSDALGAFKQELNGVRFKILKYNTYAYEKDGVINITCSGASKMPRNITLDQFDYGINITTNKPRQLPNGDYFISNEKFLINH